MADELPLEGRTVLTTRERAGRLDRRLSELGADVVHVPLVETRDPSDGGAALAAALADIDTYDWVVVTSPNGAERVAPSLQGGRCRVAAVGTRTAEVVVQCAGRPADLVPDRQTAADLVAAMPNPSSIERVLLAQADRAAPTAVDGLRDRGYVVDAVVAYRTVVRRPTPGERVAMMAADAVAFASGSAVEAWVEAVGTETPPVVAVIGPTTEDAAVRRGVKVTAVASDHSIDGLATAVLHALSGRP
jgi:uroporphyrinogen-III synthase